MKNLLIIGARGFGRTVYNLFLQCQPHMNDTTCKGFLDDKADALNGFENYPPVISGIDDYEIQPDDVFICALGSTKWKKFYAEKIIERGGKFISLIHPDVHLGLNTEIGIGSIIMERCFISCDVKVGRFVTILQGTSVGHDATVGDWSHLGALSFLGGFARVGQLATFQTNAILLPHKSVGDEATVGAGSVVILNAKPQTTVFGVPATKLNV